MHPASFICTGLFVLATIVFIAIVRDQTRSLRERVGTAVLGVLALLAFLFFPGFSPLQGVIRARRVNELCANYSVGGPFDPLDFQRKGAALGVHTIVSDEGDYALADELVILLVKRLCVVAYADGRVTKVTLSTDAP